MKDFSKAFKVGNIFIGGTFIFIVFEVYVADQMKELSIWDYLDKIVKICVTEERRHQGQIMATAQEKA